MFGGYPAPGSRGSSSPDGPGESVDNGMPANRLNNAGKVDSIGVICMFLRLDRPFSRYSRINISDARIPLAGIVEYTNLNPCSSLAGDSIVYLPHYLPSESPRYSVQDDHLFSEYVGYLKMVNPDFSAQWVKEWHVFRDRCAQPICQVGFSRNTPALRTPVHGLYMTDSCQLHPHDRTVSNSIWLGKRVAAAVLGRTLE